MANIIIHDEVVHDDLDQYGNPVYKGSPFRNWVALDDTYMIQMTNSAYAIWVLWKRVGNKVIPVDRIVYTDYYHEPMADGYIYSRGGSFGMVQCARMKSDIALYTYLRETGSPSGSGRRWISRVRPIKRVGDSLAIGSGTTLNSGVYSSSADWNYMPHVYFTRHVSVGNAPQSRTWPQTTLFFSAHGAYGSSRGDGHTRSYTFVWENDALTVLGPDVVFSASDLELLEAVCVRDNEVELVHKSRNYGTPSFRRFVHDGLGDWSPMNVHSHVINHTTPSSTAFSGTKLRDGSAVYSMPDSSGDLADQTKVAVFTYDADNPDFSPGVEWDSNNSFGTLYWYLAVPAVINSQHEHDPTVLYANLDEGETSSITEIIKVEGFLPEEEWNSILSFTNESTIIRENEEDTGFLSFKFGNYVLYSYIAQPELKDYVVTRLIELNFPVETVTETAAVCIEVPEDISIV